MITIDGDHILSYNDKAPSLLAISVGLGREWRWGNQCHQPFSVLAHSLMVDDIVDREKRDDKLRLRALLHDAHEAVTGDKITPWKTDADRRVEDDVQNRIVKRLGLPSLYTTRGDYIIEVDELAARAIAELNVHKRICEVEDYVHLDGRLLSNCDRHKPIRRLAKKYLMLSENIDDWIYPDSIFPLIWRNRVEILVERVDKERK